MILLREYLVENFIFLITIISTYFIVSMKSAVDRSLKIHMVINMTLLLVISLNAFHLKNLILGDVEGLEYYISSILYFSLNPLPMLALIGMTDRHNKYNYIPILLNFVIYCSYFISCKYSLPLRDVMESYYIPNYAYVVTEWVCWVIFLWILNIKFYRKSNKNPLGIFTYISVLMTANILDSTGIYPGILIKTYAIAFLLYYLIIHVYISQQINEEKDLKLREQRLSMMLSQIQPHFLYNTLNTITALCRVNPKLAEETTVKFSKYLRENMYSMEIADMHPFSQELEHVKIYLEIEKIRFGDRLNIEFDIQSTDFDLPVLTLQPIVENAVKHGVCKKIEGGTVKLSTRKIGRDNIITITDDGEGFDPELIKFDGKHHIGIKNANERLKSTVNTQMKISSIVGVGTEVTIVIPGEKSKIKESEGERREIHSIGR